MDEHRVIRSRGKLTKIEKKELNQRMTLIRDSLMGVIADFGKRITFKDSDAIYKAHSIVDELRYKHQSWED